MKSEIVCGKIIKESHSEDLVLLKGFGFLFFFFLNNPGVLDYDKCPTKYDSKNITIF